MAEEFVQEEEMNLSSQESEEDLETMIRTKGGDWTYQLQKAVQKGDIEYLKKCILKGGNKNVEDKKKWTPLIWAACKGHVEITRYLISQGAHEQYVANSGDAPKHVVQGTINSNIKPTPLQWACFKGHFKIVNLLLKAEMRWDDFDQFGNDCVHLAAASGNFSVFQLLIAYGVQVDRTNTRQHYCSDLSTTEEITKLINLHRQNKHCNVCKNVPKVKHWCFYCNNFVCQECKVQIWAYEEKDSQEADMYDLRCTNCFNSKEKHQQELQQKIDNYEYQSLSEKINQIQEQGIPIDVKLHNLALVTQERLKNQLMIKDYIKTLVIIEDYKRILKHVKVLTDMTEAAQKKGVVLDEDILELISQQKGRLVAERNLRYEIDNIETNNATQEQVDKLTNLMQVSIQNGVASNYLDDAEILRSKMFKGIQSATLFKLFCEYPTRWIPEPLTYDPKTKKPIDPITKKPIDIKLLPKPPKPKKGDPKFQIPIWAETVEKHQEAIKQLEELLTQSAELNLTAEFTKESKVQIARLKNDLRYRLILDKEAKEAADQKAAEKAKNKKK